MKRIKKYFLLVREQFTYFHSAIPTNFLKIRFEFADLFNGGICGVGIDGIPC